MFTDLRGFTSFSARILHTMTIPSRIALTLALVLLPAGCGDESADRKTGPRPERADRPATPPPGWRTVRNSEAGFTVAAPRTWSAATKRGRTLIRSDDRLVAVSISADRTPTGRDLPPARYARRTIRTLPNFAGRVDGQSSSLPGSPYDSAVLNAIGTVEPSSLSQQISVAIFQRPGRVTYGALVFRNAGVKPRFNERTLNRMLRSFRAQPPRSG